MAFKVDDDNFFCGYCANPVNTKLCKCFYRFHNNDKTHQEGKIIHSISCSQNNCSYLVAYNGLHVDVYCPHHIIFDKE